MNFLIGLGFLIKWGMIFLIPPLIATSVLKGAKSDINDKGTYKDWRMVIISEFMDIYKFDKTDFEDVMTLFGNCVVVWVIVLFICFLISLLGGFIGIVKDFNSLTN